MAPFANELILLFHILIISGAAVLALKLSKEALISFVALTMVLANLFVIKQTVFFGLNATTADALAVGSMIGLNLLQEFYGKQAGKTSIIVTFYCLLFYGISSQIHLWYAPSSIDTAHVHFAPILSFAPALVLGSFVVYLLAQIMDFIIYGALKTAWKGRFMIVRNYIAIGLSHLGDTILFTYWLLYLGIIQNPLHIIAISFSIKFLITLIATPIITIAAQATHEKK